MQSLKDFVDYSMSCIRNRNFIQLVCSKPRRNSEFQKANITSFDDGELKIKISKKTKTQDFTSTSTMDSFTQELTMLLTENFLFADLFCNDRTTLLKQSEKGTVNIKHKGVSQISEQHLNIGPHNRVKNYLIGEDLPFLKKLGVSGNDNKVTAPMQKKYRQINKFVELVLHAMDPLPQHLNIADMGSGKGYLTFALYHAIARLGVQVKMTGYELRPELVEICNKIAKEVDYSGLNFVAENILDADTGKLDCLIALHACDIATDLAIKKGVDASAHYIILSPCCHKQLRKEIKKTDEITKFGIYEERIAEMVTDTIRSLILEHLGYKTSIIEFISSEHTGKNTMIIANYTGQIRSDALGKVDALKQKYGVKLHYLEHLIFNQIRIN